MGKKLLLCIMAFLVTAVLMAQKQAHALDVGVGGVAWYTQWDSWGGGPDEGVYPTFMYGGILSLGFTSDWSLSTVFMYGQFEPKGTGGPGPIDRYDLDTSLNYNVFRYFKIIAGVKYMGYYWDEETQNGSAAHYSVGPALGFGLTVPLIWNFYVVCNVTGMYSFGKYDQDNLQGERSTLMREYGINSSAGLVYYIEAISTTVTVGFRSQFFRMDYDSDRERDGDFHFWGVFASVVYSFGLFE